MVFAIGSEAPSYADTPPPVAASGATGATAVPATGTIQTSAADGSPMQINPESDLKGASATPTGAAGESPDKDAGVDALPPLPPRKHGFVLETSLGALVFTGQFGKLAPPALLTRAVFGFEPTKWLLLYGEGQLAFTDTSREQPAPYTRSFPIYGFGAGVRFTVHATERVAFFGDGHLGAMKADIAYNALTILGFHDAEKFFLYFGARLGLEWYQVDRHLAVGALVGYLRASGFARSTREADSPAAIETALTLRYTF